MDLTLVTAPAVEPLSTAEAKTFLKVDNSADDTLIDSIVAAARQYVESYQDRSLITTTWKVTLDQFPADRLYLPRPPLQSISSVSYIDSAGDSQTLVEDTDFVVDTFATPGFLQPAYGLSFPAVRGQLSKQVTIQFVSGYGDASTDIPYNTLAAIRLLVGELYELRVSTVVGTILAKNKTLDWLLANETWAEAF